MEIFANAGEFCYVLYVQSFQHDQNSNPCHFPLATMS